MNAAPPRASRDWLAALETTARATRDIHRTLPRAVLEWAEQRAEAPALFGDTGHFSYAALAARMNQISRWGLRQGVRKGETVGLRLGNRPDYFAVWLGLTQIGAVVALLSPDWGEAALDHALRVSAASRLIASDDVAAAGAEVWTYARFDTEVRAESPAPLDAEERREVTLDDKALRIFTSGTTGFPKAAEVSHRRIVLWTHWFAGLAGLGPEDRHYDCLPMHHSVGGVVAIGAPLVNGGSVVIAERFSARGFLADIARFDCTSFQYIGELCRYLLAAPEAPRPPRLRLALGNGLAPDVWERFQARFAPLRVLEFYASTEGNVWLYNVEGRPGKLGRAPPALAAREPIALAAFDEETQMPWRGPDGFGRRCGVDVPGEALGRLDEARAGRFEGYSDAGETEKKILRDLFEKGDAWMRTGDLMRRDAEGFYAFVDRIGDTFRWKGENVAAAEVAAVCAGAPGVEDALVYGVAVPGCEGRAGMALLKAPGPLDLAGFARHLEALPRYARPLFLRVTAEIATTETLKPKRRLFAESGFDPARCADLLFVLHPETGAYVPLDAAVHAAIVKSDLRL